MNKCVRKSTPPKVSKYLIEDNSQQTLALPIPNGRLNTRMSLQSTHCAALNRSSAIQYFECMDKLNFCPELPPYSFSYGRQKYFAGFNRKTTTFSIAVPLVKYEIFCYVLVCILVNSSIPLLTFID